MWSLATGYMPPGFYKNQNLKDLGHVLQVPVSDSRAAVLKHFVIEDNLDIVLSLSISLRKPFLFNVNILIETSTTL